MMDEANAMSAEMGICGLPCESAEIPVGVGEVSRWYKLASGVVLQPR
jgi:hypothetical protein